MIERKLLKWTKTGIVCFLTLLSSFGLVEILGISILSVSTSPLLLGLWLLLEKQSEGE